MDKPHTKVPKRKTNFFKNLKYIISKAYEWDKGLFAIFLSVVAANIVIAMINVYFVKLLIDELSVGKRAAILIGIIIIASVLRLISGLIVSNSGSQAWYRIVMIGLKYQLMRAGKLMGMDFQDSENPNILNKLEKSKLAVSDSISISSAKMNIYLNKLYQEGTRLFTNFSYLGILILYSPVLTLLIVLSVIAEGFINIALAKNENKMHDSLSPLYRRMGYYSNKMGDNKFGKDIRIYNISKILLKKYDLTGLSIFKLIKNYNDKAYSVSILSVLINVVRYGAINLFLFNSVLYKGLSIGDFSMYLAAATAFSASISSTMTSISELINCNQYINDYFEFINLPSRPYTNIKPDLSKGCEIEFKDVTFCYPSSDRIVIKNLSLILKNGQKLALVGINGSGKTTLIKLLTGLYRPTSGQILLNGTDITNITPQEYYSLFSVIFQDINLFAWSIAENIALCELSKIDIPRLEEALKLSGLEETVSKISDGYRKSVLKILDEKGIELSGGQSQKLALARALYKSSPFIILDEPTAALDPLAEYELYQNFDKLIADKTAIYVSHRLSSTRFCDVIAYLEDGCIVELGTHEELLELGGKYADMFMKQAYYYKEHCETEGDEIYE